MFLKHFFSGINVYCVKPGTMKWSVTTFDGQNWEESYAKNELDRNLKIDDNK